MTPPEYLIDDTKDYLDITWDDPGGEKKILGFIARGMKYLDSTAGEELDYTVEDKPKELLLEYVRYARSNALDEFQNNYLSELLTLQNSKEVDRYVAEQSAEV